MLRNVSGPALILLAALLLPALSGGSSILRAQEAVSCPAPAPIIGDLTGGMAHIRYLADDALEGREAGSEGAWCAGDFIAGFFRELGLEGLGPDGSYFQRFQMQMGSVLGDRNLLEANGRPLELHREWIPFGFSSSGRITASLVYGGPGVSMPGSEMDRYAHLELEGKIVVVEGADPHGSRQGSVAGDPHHKAAIAAGRGAAAVLVLLEEDQILPDPATEERPSVRIPAAAVAGSAAEALREAARAGAEATLGSSVEPRMVEIRNVAARIPGSDPALAREVVVVGAHFDHLGYGGDGSLAPDARQVHNGADDNASGTAALMEVARHLMEPENRPRRSVLFLAFTGEEKGLRGSGHYVANPLMPLESTVAMLNMDMVGRLRENTLTVYGTGTAEEIPDLLESVNRRQPEPFVLAAIPDGFGPSDHSSFYGEGVPVLMLFTNTHAEYHRPEDDWELIDARGLERVVAFAADLTGSLAGSGAAQAVALTFQEGAGNPHGTMAATEEEGEGRPSRGYGAYMGTIPDMTPRDFGVRITGVREESPAEKAGLRGGDVLVEFGGREITDLYAYTYALREFKPGDEVEVAVLREGERLTFTAVLGQGGR
ncbi:MAG: M28 family peptidase [Gemmatimonadota bacterium]